MITVIGSANIDYVCFTERIPSLGETVAGTSFLVTAGGKGANQAVAAARLGVKTVLLTKLGQDDRYANLLTNGMRDAGVDVSCVQMEPGRYCGCAMIMVDRQARNIISIVANANAGITSDYIDEHRDLIASSKVLVVEFGVPLPTVRHALGLARKAGVITLVNPAPAISLTEDFYRDVDILVPNEVEAGQLCGQPLEGEDDLEKAAAWFHQRNVASVVITLGERGVFFSDNGRPALVPSRRVRVVDTTGAGDAFVGGLACGLAEGKSMSDAVVFANAVAALSVTRPGAARSMPTRAEVEAFTREGRCHD